MLFLSTLFFLATALVLGMRHALEPDHLVAVSTLVAEERKLWPASRLGLVWGLGHQLPLTLVGVCVLLLRWRVPESIEHAVDLGVGLILVTLGVRTFWRLRKAGVHLHVHTHGGHEHAHFHSHAPGHSRGDHDHLHPMAGRDRQDLLSFGIGLMHGLGGSGPVVVLALAGAPSVAGGIGYLLAFGTGVCIGMFALTLCILAPAFSSLYRFEALRNIIRRVAGLASLALGIFMWYDSLTQLLA